MIEVGDFVRVNGIIGKVEQIGNSLFWIEDGSSYSLDDKSVNHSKNIIDLIEVGDYVNGYKVIAKSDDGYIVILTDDIEQGELLAEEEIETILTKELYQANCYTVLKKDTRRNS